MGAKDTYLSVAVFLRIADINAWHKDVYHAIVATASRIGRGLTHIDFCDENGKPWPRSWKYNRRNEERLLKRIAEGTAQNINLSSVGVPIDYMMSPYAASTEVLLNDQIAGMVYLQIEYDRCIPTEETLEVFLWIVGKMDSIGDVRYAFATPMLGDRYPMLTMRGSTISAMLTPDENRAGRCWEKRRSEFDSVIWKSYWGNMLSSGHSNGSASKLRTLAKHLRDHSGAKIIEISNDKFVYSAPFTVDCRKPDQVKELADFGKTCDDICRCNGVEVVC